MSFWRNRWGKANRNSSDDGPWSNSFETRFISPISYITRLDFKRMRLCRCHLDRRLTIDSHVMCLEPASVAHFLRPLDSMAFHPCVINLDVWTRRLESQGERKHLYKRVSSLFVIQLFFSFILIFFLIISIFRLYWHTSLSFWLLLKWPLTLGDASKVSISNNHTPFPTLFSWVVANETILGCLPGTMSAPSQFWRFLCV